jgi:IS30 family transposase
MACQLSFEERERLSQLYEDGESARAIAREFGRAPSTISRELRRNSEVGHYSAVVAQGKWLERRRQRPLVRKLERPAILDAVRGGLTRRWSPDQIAGRLRRAFPQCPAQWVSHQTIYTWLAALPLCERRHFRAFLRRGRPRRPRNDRRGCLPRQTPIGGRPAVVDRRQRYGDWEGDTIVGARQSGAVVTLVERRSGYLMTAKSCDRKSGRVSHKIRSRLGDLPPELRRTLTLDNGKEFADHERFAHQLDLAVYFAEPYCSWQRGTNEHTNGLLRQFLPKGTDLRQVSWQQLEHYTTLINDRPRKRLGYRTPAEILEPLVAIES